MYKYTVYQIDDGRIIVSGNYRSHAPVEMDLAQLQDDYSCGAVEVFEGETLNTLTHYIDPVSKLPALRPSLNIQTTFEVQADGEDVVSFPLPSGTKIIFRDIEHFVDETEQFGFVTDEPGSYIFEIEPPFPAVPTTVTINAV